MHESIKQSASDAHAAMDHNSNGTVSLGDVKNNIVDSAKATKEAISNAAQAIEDKIDSDGDGDADMQGVKQAFHRAAENMKASLEAFGESMSEFFDRDGDGKHTLSNVTHAGGEISDATTAGFQKVGAAAEDMMETLSTMTWDEEDVEDEDEKPEGALLQLQVSWSLKTYLKENGEEMKAALVAMHESIKQSASDAHAAMDHNSNGTVSLGDVKNNIVDSAKATKEAISNAAQAIEDKIDSDGDGDADMQV